MIHTEIVTIRGKQFRRTYSDTHMLIRDSVEYEEAFDPVDTDMLYEESTTKLTEEIGGEEFLDMIEGVL